MFNSLTDRLGQTIKDLTGRGRLSENNMRAALDDVKKALLEADVALPVVKKFVMNVKQKALGQKILKSLSPGQALVKLVKKELTLIMGQANETLNLKATPPVIVLMAGLQGSGKTTTTAKLGKFLQERENKKVMVVSVDVYRPAAIEQLRVLADDNKLAYHPSSATEKPLDIAKAAYSAAKHQGMDVLLLDTAGRLHINEAMMKEVRELSNFLQPTETLFIVDSMTGQDAANTAKAFNDSLSITGVILTKTDGDARGGAALSIREITGKPIKFLGVGEKIGALQPFHPERVASRILGMGDVLSLIEEAEQHIDKAQAEKLAKKLDKGKFDLEDFQQQLKQMSNMGGMGNIMDKMPSMMGLGQLPDSAKSMVNDKMFKGIEAIISSMTKKERRAPEIIKASRKKRIAAGSGTTIQEVNKLLKQFEQMQTMMRKFSKKGGLKGMMQLLQNKMGGASGGLPPGIGGMM